MNYSVVIATHNRANDLRGTLASIATIESRHAWEVIVVDNNCTDGTPSVVRDAAPGFPVPLRYTFESVPGRSAALNAGIALARGAIVVTTDDDVRIEPDWLDQIEAAFSTLNCDYIGGRVLPIWGGPRPRWIPEHRTRHWAVIALLDEGPQPFEWKRVLPLGVNMAVRRSAFETAGGWDPRVGRKAGTLLGQEVREWCLRAQAKGLRGFYAPNVVLRHIIPKSRLKKSYFRRWFYWRGISRALLYQQHGFDMENPQRRTLDFGRVPHIAGVPRYLFRTAGATALTRIQAGLRGDETMGFEHELLLCMYAGIARQRWTDRHAPFTWLDGHGAGALIQSTPHAS
jgi:glycosyltransferase involved in cell wall biosynthesis